MIVVQVWHFSTHISGDIVGVCVTTLGSHENGVHVLGLSNGLIATTSTGEYRQSSTHSDKFLRWYYNQSESNCCPYKCIG